MKKTKTIIYTFLCGVALVLGFSLLATIQTSKLQKATKVIGEVTEIIGEVEKRGDIKNPKILEDQQQMILQEIKSLKQLPVIPSSKNASLQKLNIQKLQSLLPALQANINSIKALQSAEGYAYTAKELTRKVKQYNPVSGAEFLYNPLLSLSEYWKQETSQINQKNKKVGIDSFYQLNG